MTVFRNFDDLCKAIFEEMKGMKTEQEIRESATLRRLAELASIYMEAESNPPEGVIGVGCITYAEQMLQAAQNV
jgi:hypothetical protein